MECPKCNGLMYTESILDFDRVSHLWKCINCGALIDPIILENRRASIALLAVSQEKQKAALPRLKKVGVGNVALRYASSN